MSKRTVILKELDEFTRNADAVTDLMTDFGTWAAIVTVEDQDYEVEAPRCDPTATGTIKPVSREEADEMVITDYRTVRRY